jgi:asparagine synthase (glutamine-hydrolysing)
MPWLPDGVWLALERLRGRAAPRAANPVRPAFAATQRLSAEAAWRALDRGARVPADGRRQRLSYAMNRAAHHLPAWRAQFGVDVRDPTGDQRLVEFCLALPPDQFQRNGQARWLIRRAMAGRLPPEVLNSRQRGLQSSDWLYRLRSRREELTQTLRRIQQDELAARMLDVPRLERLLETWAEPAAGDRGAVEEYHLLQEALVAGRFIEWARAGATGV